jgi:hypothetical protein
MLRLWLTPLSARSLTNHWLVVPLWVSFYWQLWHMLSKTQGFQLREIDTKLIPAASGSIRCLPRRLYFVQSRMTRSLSLSSTFIFGRQRERGLRGHEIRTEIWANPQWELC